MGLDITAYSHLKHIGKHEKDPALNQGEPGGIDDRCYYDGHVVAFAYACFPASFRGIPILDTRTVGRETFIVGGCYETTPDTQTCAFQFSYGGYNRWRADLARRFNPAPMAWDEDGPGMAQPDPDLPFYELIWFADNEGTIGPDAAADLLDDFRQHTQDLPPDALSFTEEGDFQEGYREWMRACELAASGGLIRFH